MNSTAAIRSRTKRRSWPERASLRVAGAAGGVSPRSPSSTSAPTLPWLGTSY